MTLEGLDPGFGATVEDAGRSDFAHLGVPPGGAQDAWSLAVANILVGNPADDAALEMTIVGPRLRAVAPITVALAGADLGARHGSRRVMPGEAVGLDVGDELGFDGPGSGSAGARAYLALAGGIDVPLVLGSRSTCLVAGFGGLDGRALRTGDLIGPRARRGRDAMPEAVAGARWPGPAGPLPRYDAHGATVVRVVARVPDSGVPIAEPPDRARSDADRIPGPHASLLHDAWRVGSASDRMGLRLERDASTRATTAVTGAGPTGLREVASHGVTRGAVQWPPSGDPIVLLADHQPTGGYPVVAVVITADHPALGQLAPGARVRFDVVSLGDARRALADQRHDWAGALARYRADRGWDDLWLSAGG